jgi:dienelactone hydrolase
LTLQGVGEVAIDELVVAVQVLVRDVAEPADVEANVRRAGSVAAALADCAPADLHPAVEPAAAMIDPTRRRRYRMSWLDLSFDSPRALPDPLTAEAGWLDAPATQRAHVRLLTHPGDPRPWVITVHGAEQGNDLDLLALRAKQLHEDLGLNVAVPVLPLHGPRRLPGVHIPAMDPVGNIVWALVAVAEIRALRRWIEQQGDQPVGLYGVSLGGYLTALTAGVEPDLDVVVAGIPMVSINRLLARHAVRSLSREGRRMGALLRADPVRDLERFVDPLAFEPAVPVERRHVIAGLVDRITTPHQALVLWEHWGQPEITWFRGGHLGHAWSRDARAHVDRALADLGPTERATGGGS